MAATRGKFPPLRLRLHKEVPPGSGLGGGSGNAATLISWLNLFLSEENSLRGEEVGSDVPFFLEGGKWAQVGGRGEDVQRLPYNPPHYHVVVAIPSWSMSTRRAFSLLAARFGSSRLMSEDQAEMERDDVMGKLGACRHYGLLPNDFAPFLMEAHPEYNDLFRTFDEGGALAWGITGSGGAAFSFFIDGDECARTAAVLGGIGWIKKILILE
ncbi:MAG: hypothetical protein QM446_04440 [Synergistota bacterium]|nr:hypothetical protein [Synergistota bacterium]